MANSNSNKKLVPEAMSALDKFKYEVASEIGVTLKDGYNGDISAKDAGKIGGNMVRKMIQQVENNMKYFFNNVFIIYLLGRSIILGFRYVFGLNIHKGRSCAPAFIL